MGHTRMAHLLCMHDTLAYIMAMGHTHTNGTLAMHDTPAYIMAMGHTHEWHTCYACHTRVHHGPAYIMAMGHTHEWHTHEGSMNDTHTCMRMRRDNTRREGFIGVNALALWMTRTGMH